MTVRWLVTWLAFASAMTVVVACSDGGGDRGLGAGAAAASGGAAATGNGGDGGAGAAELCNGADDDGDGLIDEELAASCGPCGRPWDLDVEVVYPVSATWMFARGEACAWQDALEAFHRQGGQVVWQFGPSFVPKSAEDLKSDPELVACVENGQHCVDAAFADLLAAHPANTVANWLVYGSNESHSDAVLGCPAFDRKIVIGNRTFWRIVLPHAVGQDPCQLDGAAFDVLFTWFEPARAGQKDSPTLLLEAADALGMEVYLGMPCAPPVAGQAWNVDTTLRPAFLAWSERVLADYALRHGDHPSFRGVYQTFEVSLTGTGLDTVYETYAMVGQRVRAALPNRAYALSPYWDANKQQGDHSIASIKEGFKRLARQDVDIIAPQDGRGTGKAGLYWPYQLGETIASVDPLLAAFANVDGNATFAEQFNASTRELYRAARDAVSELQSENVSVALWANIEAFESLGTAPCVYPFALERTDKPRLDWALTMAGAAPSRIISFMWDAYYWCLDGGYRQSLAEEILADGHRPIAADAELSGGELVVRGYHLAAPGTVFHINWYDAGWTLQGATLSPTSTTSDWGSANGSVPGLDEARMPFDVADIAPAFYLHVRPAAGDLAAHHVYSLAY